jgi:hypothetical protein
LSSSELVDEDSQGADFLFFKSPLFIIFSVEKVSKNENSNVSLVHVKGALA